MKDKSSRKAKTIRMDEDVYHQARIAAVISSKSLGQWIEEAVGEKLSNEEVQLPRATRRQLNGRAQKLKVDQKETQEAGGRTNRTDE